MTLELGNAKNTNITIFLWAGFPAHQMWSVRSCGDPLLATSPLLPHVVWKCRTDSALMQWMSEANSRTAGGTSANKPILSVMLTDVICTVLEAETKALGDVQDPQKVFGAKHE